MRCGTYEFELVFGNLKVVSGGFDYGNAVHKQDVQYIFNIEKC